MATPFSSVPWLANPGAWWARDTAAGQLGVQIARNQIAAEGQRAELLIAAQKLPLQQAAIRANIEQDLMRNKISQLAIDHELKMTESQEAVAEIYKKAAEDPEHWASPNMPKWVAPAVQQYPWLAGTKQLDEIFRFNQTATEAKRRADLDNDRAIYQSDILNLRRELADKEKQYAPSDRQKAVDDVFNEEVKNRDVRGLPPMTDVEASDLRKSLLNSSFPSRDNVESTMMGVDDQGKPYLRIQKGGGPGTNIATENLAQKNLMRDEKLNTQLLSLRTDLRWQDVGIAGAAGELLGDRFLPQFGFNTSDPQRQKNRTELKAALMSAYGSLSSDPRVTNYDKQKIEALGPSTQWDESIDRARQAARTLSEVTKNRAQIDAKMAQMPIQDWMLTQRDIENEVQKGTMVPERAFDLKVKYYPDTLTPEEIKTAVKSKKMSNSVGVHLLKTLYPERFPN